jgi:hypothetical protein
MNEITTRCSQHGLNYWCAINQALSNCAML